MATLQMAACVKRDRSTSTWTGNFLTNGKRNTPLRGFNDYTMRQQYIMTLLEAYRRGYEKKSRLIRNNQQKTTSERFVCVVLKMARCISWSMSWPVATWWMRFCARCTIAMTSSATWLFWSGTTWPARHGAVSVSRWNRRNYGCYSTPVAQKNVSVTWCCSLMPTTTPMPQTSVCPDRWKSYSSVLRKWRL